MELYPITIPGGSDTEVQYNNGGIFGAISGFTLDDATGVVSITGIGGSGLTGYDLKIGDTTTPDYGLLQAGACVFGRVPYNAMAMDLDGSVIIRNLTAPATSNIEFAFLESGGTSVRFALAKSAAGNASYCARSMLIAGPSVWDDEIVTVGYWQTNNNIFDNLACDTAGDGADLGVQNDLEVEGDIFCDSLKESTSGGGITVQPLADSTTFFQVNQADGTNFFNLDSTNTRFGLRTTPAKTVDIAVTGRDDFYLRDDRSYAGGVGGEITFLGKYNSGGDYQAFGALRGIKESGTDGSKRGNLVFLTCDSSGVLQTALVIDSAGQFGVRDGSPNAMFGLSSYGGRDYFKCSVSSSSDGDVMVIKNNGFFGLGEKAPETFMELTNAAPYITLHNSTHEDTDGGGEVRIIGKREDGAGTETAAGQIEISHDGSGANDQLGKIEESVNTGSGLVVARRLDNNGTFHSLFGRITKRTSVTSSPYTVLVTDHHISVTTASTAITLNLPAIVNGTVYHIKDQDENSAGKNITVSPDGSDTIENAASLTINTNGASITLVGNSTTSNWEIQ